MSTAYQEAWDEAGQRIPRMAAVLRKEVRVFVEECCSPSFFAVVPRAVMLEMFTSWNGGRPVSGRMFTSLFRDAAPYAVERNVSGERCWIGVSVAGCGQVRAPGNSPTGGK